MIKHLVHFLFVLSIGSALMLAGAIPAYAVFSNSVLTKIGNPISAPPSLGNSSVVDTAAHITSLLALGPNNENFYVNGELQDWYNVKTDEPGVYYWCNYLVADSYSAAGFNLSRADSFGYSNLINYFKTTSGLEFFPASTPVEELHPGTVVFFGSDGLYHVSIIYSINIDSDGDGSMGTYDSNNVVVKDTISVVNHIAQNANSTKNLYKITGFGQTKD